MRNLFTILVLAMILSGCSTLGLPGGDSWWSYNPQNYQGCTVIVHSETIDGQRVDVTWYDCKDKAHVAAKVDLNSDGVDDFTYTATDVIGSTAAQIRAEVEKTFSDNGVEAAPAVIDGIVDSILGL